MFIEQKLRIRIINTLRWMVTDATHRFDDCAGNLDLGIDGAYSPELKEAIELLALLEATAPAPTEQQCRDMAFACGLSEAWGSAYYRQYASQGWLKGNGVPIVDVRMHMVNLRNEGVAYADGPAPTAKTDVAGLTPRQRHIQDVGR